jgi:hypothetical protein
VHPGLLQRKCACGGKADSDGERKECRKQKLQRKANGFDHGTENNLSAPPIVHEVLRSPGQPLDAETRAFMEPRFGHDFSQVRVHTDDKAITSAQEVNALAYTVGRNIVFSRGQYEPTKAEGKKLLAHELTHTLQQDSGSPHSSLPNQLLVGRPGDRSETEAERFAQFIVAPPPYGCRGNLIASRRDINLARNLRPNAIDEVDTPLTETLVVGKNKTHNYSWHAKYSIYMYDNGIVVEVRIKLNGKVADETKRLWQEGINAKWNDKYRFTNGKRTVSLSFWAVFTDVNPHAVVDVVNKPKTSGDWDRSHWDAGDGEGDTQGDAAAHEFGHMIGNKDEYNLPDGKGGKKNLDGVMNSAHQEAKERHFQQFLDWLNAHRAKGEGQFKLEKLK